jgi:hypothetical protein
MLGIITCIRHPDSVEDFNQIKSLLSDTIRTLESQSSTDFKFYVVCNTGSNLIINTSVKVEIIEVNIDCPPYIEVIDVTTQELKWQSVRKDKGTKFYFGLQRAKVDSLDYIMFIDGDDYLHKDVVKYIALNKYKFDGLIIDKGYSYSKTSFLLGTITPFNEVCGTCNSYSMRILGRYISNKNFMSQDELLENVDNNFIIKVLGSHLNAEFFIKSEEGIIGFFPFHASIYLVGHGQNDSKNSEVVGKPTILNNSIRKNFSLEGKLHNCITNIYLFIYYRICYYLKLKLNDIRVKLLKINSQR